MVGIGEESSICGLSHPPGLDFVSLPPSEEGSLEAAFIIQFLFLLRQFNGNGSLAENEALHGSPKALAEGTGPSEKINILGDQGSLGE
jgi:hypothetical protein